MAWGSNITQAPAPIAPYQGNPDTFYRMGAGERKKEFDLKVANARAQVRSQFIAPKLEALKTALAQAEAELVQLKYKKVKGEQSSADMNPFDSYGLGSLDASRHETPAVETPGIPTVPAPGRDVSMFDAPTMDMAQPVFPDNLGKAAWQSYDNVKAGAANSIPQQNYMNALAEYKRAMTQTPIFGARR